MNRSLRDDKIIEQFVGTILLIEDEPSTAEFICRSLEDEGYDVITVSTGKDAGKIIRSGSRAIDLVLIDIDMGKKGDGIRTARNINKKSSIPVVFLIDRNDIEILEKTKKITAYGYVVKDAGAAVLNATLKTAFNLHVAHDELRKKEKALGLSEIEYRSTLNAMIDAIHVVDRGMHILLMNDAFKKWTRRLGLPEGTERKTIFEQFPFLSEEIRVEYEKVFATGEILITEDTNTVGGREYITETRKIPVSEEGEITKVITIVRDITEHKRADEALKISEEKYRNILETMEEGLYENDLRGNYTFVNGAASRQMGYDFNEMVGMNFKKVVSPETARYLYTEYSRIFETGEPALLMNYEVYRKDGSAWVCQANVSLIRDHEGKPVGFRNLTRDVSELKKAEEEKTRLEQQLLQAQKLESIGRLAGGIAHDFNNMLTVILGYTELIKSGMPQGDLLSKDILEIEKAATRSRDITGQLLGFSRKQIIAPMPIDLNLLITGTKETLARLIGEDIDLRFIPGDDLWNIRFDRSQMEQILINLAVNARDAMPAGGTLSVETENVQLAEVYCKAHAGFIPGSYVRLAVSDDGEGMDQETLQYVFEPFFTTKKTGKGTGLGLATVYGIVKQNNGFINVYSETGGGATFKIYIPRSIEEEEPAGTIADESMPTAGTGTVLLIEDDDMVRGMTTNMLETIGYETRSTANPHEALSIVENFPERIDLVITDVVMPGLSGKELWERMKATRPGIKFLFISGYTSDVILHRGILEEGMHFLQKPFGMNELARKIRNAIEDTKPL